MNKIASTLGVSRSNLYSRPDIPRKRGPYTKFEDEKLLSIIKEIVAEHPSYGYRRILVLCNRILKKNEQPEVNHKRIYRIMKQNRMLLPKYSGKYDTRQHDGKVSVSNSNQRWCGDGFEVTCENGEKARFIFCMDCCDREIMAFAATTGGYTADMAQNVLLASVEKRFFSLHAPQIVEWLTDNGSCFNARGTQNFARELGIECRFTPVRSPQSNGMAEALVKTIKRDYVYCHQIPDARTAISLMKNWIEDYNENAPHKALKMLSPREFIRKRNAPCKFTPEPRK